MTTRRQPGDLGAPSQPAATRSNSAAAKQLAAASAQDHRRPVRLVLRSSDPHACAWCGSRWRTLAFRIEHGGRLAVAILCCACCTALGDPDRVLEVLDGLADLELAGLVSSETVNPPKKKGKATVTAKPRRRDRRVKTLTQGKDGEAAGLALT